MRKPTQQVRGLSGRQRKMKLGKASVVGWLSRVLLGR